MRRLVRALPRLTAAIAGGAASTLLATWCVGRLLSDAWGWSQWLLWIPSPVAVAAAVVGLLAALRPPPASRPGWRRRRLGVWAAIATLLLLRLLFVEHRFHRGGTSTPDGLTIVHWNIAHHADASPARYTETLTSLGADVYVLTNAAAIAFQPEWVGHTERIHILTPFTLVTRLPLIEWRRLIASEDGVHVALLVVDAGGPLARPLRIWVIDMPSSPRVSRMALGRRLRELLDSVNAPAPDLVVGDLNMTRGSAALRHALPDLANAFDVAGHGYGATFPAQLPLYHIDHVLVRRDLTPLDYSIVDPGFGRHRLQRVTIPGSSAP